MPEVSTDETAEGKEGGQSEEGGLQSEGVGEKEEEAAQGAAKRQRR
jgi:hypothetical protein